MEVTKIDISKEKMDIPWQQPTVDFVERPPLSVMVKEGSALEQNGSITKRTYHRITVSARDGIKQFLIPLDDKGLFQELIKITNDQFEKAIENKTEFWRERVLSELWAQREAIKRLPWWKRLFKKF